MLRPVIPGKCLFELQRLCSFSPPPVATFQNFVESSAFIFVILRPRGERFAFGLRSAEQGKLGHGFLWNDLFGLTPSPFTLGCFSKSSPYRKSIKAPRSEERRVGKDCIS